MPKWNVYGIVIGSKYLGKVDADTEEQAIEKAERTLDCSASLCHQCSDEIEDPEIDKIEVYPIDDHAAEDK